VRGGKVQVRVYRDRAETRAERKRTGRSIEIKRLRTALTPFARHYNMNDCHESKSDDAIEVPIADLLGAVLALRRS